MKISALPEFGGGCMLLEEIPIIRPRIDSKGNVFLCRSFLNPDLSIGNIFDEEISDIFDGGKAEKIIDILKKRTEESFKRKKCFCRGEICQGGCAAQAYNRTGSLFAKSLWSKYKFDGTSSFFWFIFLKGLHNKNVNNICANCPTFNILSVLPNGDVGLCAEAYRSNDLKFGNINQQELEEI